VFYKKSKTTSNVETELLTKDPHIQHKIQQILRVTRSNFVTGRVSVIERYLD